MAERRLPRVVVKVRSAEGRSPLWHISMPEGRKRLLDAIALHDAGREGEG